MRSLVGRVAVVTGAGSGIGRATSELLARRGCLWPSSTSTRPRFRRRRGSYGKPAVRRPPTSWMSPIGGQIDSLPDQVLASHHGCHIVVNNAGVTSAGAFEEESLEDLRWIVDINVWGVVHGCRAFLPVAATGRGGAHREHVEHGGSHRPSAQRVLLAHQGRRAFVHRGAARRADHDADRGHGCLSRRDPNQHHEHGPRLGVGASGHGWGNRGWPRS